MRELYFQCFYRRPTILCGEGSDAGEKGDMHLVGFGSAYIEAITFFTGVNTFNVENCRLSVCALKTAMAVSVQMRPLIFVVTLPIFRPSRKGMAVKETLERRIVYVVCQAE